MINNSSTKKGIVISNSRSFYRDIGLIVIICAITVVILTFRDYGITNDEEVQNVYGIKLLSFYTSFFSDRSAFSYLDLYRYGGFFDLLAALVNIISPLGEYETRHLLGGLIGVSGLVGIWRLGRLVGGERVGFLALMLLLLTPSYYGQSFNNPKDGPFAAAMIWACYYLCRMVMEFPSPSRKTVLRLGCFWGIAMGIRVVAVLLVPYFLILLTMFLYIEWKKSNDSELVWRHCRQLVISIWPALFVTYFIMTICWPWGGVNPFNPIRALHDFSNYQINLETLVAGSWVKAAHVPRDYLPEYLLVNLPEAVIVGFTITFFCGITSFLTFMLGKDRSLAKMPVERQNYLLKVVLVGLSAIFPVVSFIFYRPTAYNGLRHFLFVVPAFVMLAAIGIDWLWSKAERFEAKVGSFCAVILTVLFVIQSWVMVQLHPDEYIYYNVLTGGVKGAQGSYELDYWGNSLIEATNELAEFIALENGDKPVTKIYKVSVCGHRLSAAYFFPEYMEYTQKVDESDFLIAFTQHNCHRQFEGKQIISVDRFGAALSVVKDRRYLENRNK